MDRKLYLHILESNKNYLFVMFFYNLEGQTLTWMIKYKFYRQNKTKKSIKYLKVS